MLFPSPAPPTPPACHQQHPPHSTAMAPHNGGYACPPSRTTRLARRRCPWTTHNHCQQAPQRPQPRVPGASALRRSIRRGPAARSALGAFPRSAQDEAASGGRTSLPPLRSPCRGCGRWKILLKPTVLQVPTSQSNCDMPKDRTHVASQSSVYIILPSNTSTFITFSNPKSRSLPFSGSHPKKKLQSPNHWINLFSLQNFRWPLESSKSDHTGSQTCCGIQSPELVLKSEKHHKTKISKSQEIIGVYIKKNLPLWLLWSPKVCCFNAMRRDSSNWRKIFQCANMNSLYLCSAFCHARL